MFEQLNNRFKKMDKQNEELDTNLKNLITKVDKNLFRLNTFEQIIKEKTDNITNEINESLQKSQTRFDKQFKSLVKEMDLQKGGFKQKIDESREFTWQELNKHTINVNQSLDDFKSQHIQSYTFEQKKVNHRLESIDTKIIQIESDST